MVRICDILPRARSLFRDRLAVRDGDARFTFGQLAQRADALAGALTGAGLGKGDRVAILDVNSHRYLEAYYACTSTGMVLLPLNVRTSPPELTYILNDAKARAILVAAPFFEVFEGARPSLADLELVVAYGAESLPAGANPYEAFLSGAALPETHSDPDPEDISQIYYTSGTTGEPKGVCLTYGNMAASAMDSIIGLGLTYEDVWLHAAPMFHLVDAWSVWSFPLMGAPQVCMAFEPEAYMRLVQETKATATGLPGTLINMVANHPKVGEYDLSSMRTIMYGGSPTPLGVLQQAMRAVPTNYVHAYGITETSGITTLVRRGELVVEGTDAEVALAGSAGHPLASIELAVADDGGNPLAVGEVGEVAVAGPRVMKSYWNKPDQTAAVLRDGWYFTGDMGYLDEDGRLFIVDRKKDMIITGGENVYPAEVETAVSTHPAVLEVAVIGVPDPQWGEAVKAVVVPRDGVEVTEEALIAHCKGRIANYKIPKSVDFSTDPLPKTGPGKVAKRILRDPYWEGKERAI